MRAVLVPTMSCALALLGCDEGEPAVPDARQDGTLAIETEIEDVGFAEGGDLIVLTRNGLIRIGLDATERWRVSAPAWLAVARPGRTRYDQLGGSRSKSALTIASRE